MTTARTRRTNAISEHEIEQRRNAILQHAATVILANGVAGCTLGAVSKESGFSIGMLQHHFATRSRLIDECLHRQYTYDRSRWVAIVSSTETPIDRLCALIDYTAEGEEDIGDVWGFWIEVTAAARLDDDLRDAVNDQSMPWMRKIEELLDDVIAESAPDALCSAAELARMFVGLADGLAAQAVNDTYDMDAPEMRRLLYRLTESMLQIELKGGMR